MASTAHVRLLSWVSLSVLFMAAIDERRNAEAAPNAPRVQRLAKIRVVRLQNYDPASLLPTSLVGRQLFGRKLLGRMSLPSGVASQERRAEEQLVLGRTSEAVESRRRAAETLLVTGAAAVDAAAEAKDPREAGETAKMAQRLLIRAKNNIDAAIHAAGGRVPSLVDMQEDAIDAMQEAAAIEARVDR